MEVDVVRKRIGLSMKLDAAPVRASGDRNDRGGQDLRGAANTHRPRQEEVCNSLMADKLAALRQN